MSEQILMSFANGTSLPIQVVAQTNWSQYMISIVLGSIGILWFLSLIFKDNIAVIVTKYRLYQLTKLTGRKSLLIAHHDQGGLFSFSMITRSDVLRLEKALLKAKGTDLNLIIHSPGGDAFAGLLMSRMLKTYPGKIYCYVPQYAMSGGSLLALSAHELYMNEYSCLGPIDPQVGSIFGAGPAAGWKEIVRKKGKKADDKSFLYDRAGRQAEQMIREHLQLLLAKPGLVDLFTDGRYHHGQPFTQHFLQDQGMKVQLMDDRIDVLLKRIVSSPIEQTVVMNL